MKAITVLILTVYFSLTASAQPNPDTLWTRMYGGSANEIAYSVQQTSDGGYILAGITGSFGAGLADFYLLKTDSQGDTLWTRTYGGINDEYAYAVRQTADGGYIVAGVTWSSGTESHDFYLVKTDSLGDTLWTRTYGGSDYDGAYSVQQTSDGGYVVAGVSFGAGSDDFFLVKTDSFGDTLWTRTYGGSDSENALSVQQTTDGGYILAGSTYSLGAGEWDFYLVKTDSQGDTLWTRTYGGSNWDYAFSVQQTADGGYVMAGYTFSFGAGSCDFYLVKTNSQGDTLWTRIYGGTGLDRAYSVQLTADGGYVVVGFTDSFGAGGYDFYLVKTGPDQLDTEPVRMSLPSQFTLYPNFPNPFNASTQIKYEIPKATHVILCVFNVLGEEVATLADEVQSAGLHTFFFDGSDLASGVYLYRLQTERFVQTRKMVLLK